MPVMEYEVVFPFPAARLELSLGVRDEPVALREYALVVEVSEPDGSPIPKGLLNWGYSAPLGGCYQYVPEASPSGLASISLPVISERPVGQLRATVVSWKPVVPGTDPHEIFDSLMVTFSANSTGDTSTPARFSTVRRSILGDD